MILGCDPGKTGALAWVTRDGHLVDVQDMPIIEVRGKMRVASAELAAMMRERAVDIVVVEGVGAMPGNGAVSMFGFGYSAGVVEGVAAGVGLALHIVPAATWKRKAGVPADKGAARQMASRLWPGAAHYFKRVKDDGRSEACLLARWAALGGVQ